MPKLSVLKLDTNNLEGQVPSAWAPGAPDGGLPSLRTLTLFGNGNMTGCLPGALAGAGPGGSGFFQAAAGQATQDAQLAAAATNSTGFCSS